MNITTPTFLLTEGNTCWSGSFKLTWRHWGTWTIQNWEAYQNNHVTNLLFNKSNYLFINWHIYHSSKWQSKDKSLSHCHLWLALRTIKPLLSLFESYCPLHLLCFSSELRLVDLYLLLSLMAFCLMQIERRHSETSRVMLLSLAA